MKILAVFLTVAAAADPDQYYNDSGQPQREKRAARPLPDVLAGHGFGPAFGHGHALGYGHGIGHGIGHAHSLGHDGHFLGHGRGLQYVSQYGFDTGYRYGIGTGHGHHGYGFGHGHLGHGLGLGHAVGHRIPAYPYGAFSHLPGHVLHKRDAEAGAASEPGAKASAKAGGKFHSGFGLGHRLGHGFAGRSHDSSHLLGAAGHVPVLGVGHDHGLTKAVAHGHAVGHASLHGHTVAHGHAVGQASLHGLRAGHDHVVGHAVGLGHAPSIIALQGHVGHGHAVDPGYVHSAGYLTEPYPVGLPHLGHNAVVSAALHDQPVVDHSVHVFDHADSHVAAHDVKEALGQKLGHALGHSLVRGLSSTPVTGPYYYLAFPAVHHG